MSHSRPYVQHAANSSSLWTDPATVPRCAGGDAASGLVRLRGGPRPVHHSSNERRSDRPRQLRQSCSPSSGPSGRHEVNSLSRGARSFAWLGAPVGHPNRCGVQAQGSVRCGWPTTRGVGRSSRAPAHVCVRTGMPRCHRPVAFAGSFGPNEASLNPPTRSAGSVSLQECQTGAGATKLLRFASPAPPGSSSSPSPRRPRIRNRHAGSRPCGRCRTSHIGGPGKDPRPSPSTEGPPASGGTVPPWAARPRGACGGQPSASPPGLGLLHGESRDPSPVASGAGGAEVDL